MVFLLNLIFLNFFSKIPSTISSVNIIFTSKMEILLNNMYDKTTIKNY